MKIPVIYHTLKPLVDIGIDKFNTTDGKEMDHETTASISRVFSFLLFFPSRRSTLSFGVGGGSEPRPSE